MIDLIDRRVSAGTAEQVRLQHPWNAVVKSRLFRDVFLSGWAPPLMLSQNDLGRFGPGCHLGHPRSWGWTLDKFTYSRRARLRFLYKANCDKIHV